MPETDNTQALGDSTHRWKFVGALTGNASTATTLATGRTFSISDNNATNTGPASSSFNGSANLTIKLPATIKATLAGNASSATKVTQLASTAADSAYRILLSTSAVDTEEQGSLNKDTDLRWIPKDNTLDLAAKNGNGILKTSNGTLTLDAASTIYINNSSSYSVIFTTGGADTSHEYARFNKNGNLILSSYIGSTVNDITYKLYVNGTSAHSDYIYRAYNASDGTPMFWMNGSNYDNYLWQISSGTDNGKQYYGYGLKYIGSGDGAANYLRLMADNVGGTDVTAIGINQSGQVGIGADASTSYRLYVNGTGYFANNVTLANANIALQRVGRSVSWHKGRDSAVVKTTSINGYGALASIKTKNGSWDIGAYDHSSYADDLLFSYVTDTLYNGSSSTTTAQIKFLENGHIVANLDGNATTATRANITTTDNAIARYNGTSGNFANSGVTIDDSNNINTAGTLTAKSVYIFGTATSDKTQRFFTSDSLNNIYASIKGVSSLVITDTAIRSGISADGTIDLGAQNAKWDNVYANTYASGGTWNGNAIDVAYGGTGATTAAAARTNLLAATGNARIFYGTCATAANVTQKNVSCAAYDALTVGDIIFVTFAHTNSGAVANLRLNVNGTGEKPLKFLSNMAKINLPAVGYILANTPYRFVYDGTNWVMDLYYNTDTNTAVRTYKATNDIDLPILMTNSAASQTAANASITTYSNRHAAIANTNSPTINPSTGVLTASGGIVGNLTGTASKATAANLTTTANAIAYYTNTTGTFGTKASANGALYATSTNGALTFGTLPIAQGGTGATSAANALKKLVGTTAIGDSNTPIYWTGSAFDEATVSLPIGSIIIQADNWEQEGWAKCDGRVLYPGEFDPSLLNSNFPDVGRKGTRRIINPQTNNEVPANIIKYLSNKKPEALVLLEDKYVYLFNYETGALCSGCLDTNFRKASTVDYGYNGTSYVKIVASKSSNKYTVQQYTTTNINAATVSWTLSTTWTDTTTRSTDYSISTIAYNGAYYVLFEQRSGYVNMTCYTLKNLNSGTALKSFVSSYNLSAPEWIQGTQIFTFRGVNGSTNYHYLINGPDATSTSTIGGYQNTVMGNVFAYDVSTCIPYNSSYYLLYGGYNDGTHTYTALCLYSVSQQKIVAVLYNPTFYSDANHTSYYPGTYITGICFKNNTFYLYNGGGDMDNVISPSASSIYQLNVNTSSSPSLSISEVTSVTSFAWALPLIGLSSANIWQYNSSFQTNYCYINNSGQSMSLKLPSTQGNGFYNYFKTQSEFSSLNSLQIFITPSTLSLISTQINSSYLSSAGLDQFYYIKVK